ncbi:MAG: DUF6526 family protein [Thermoanaerobaculia bacterium]
MADIASQDYSHHRRIDPPMHYFVFGVFVVNFFWALWTVVAGPVRNFTSIWAVLMAAALVVLFFKVRLYPLKVQDRIIRLEERLRLATLLPDGLRARIGELTTRQLVALRFASDGELPSLVQATLDSALPGEEIKKKIQSWRADVERV